MNEYIDFNKVRGLKDRTKKFALLIIKLYRMLPKTGEARIIGDQLLRCGTSVGSNYRAACRGRSDREFYAKLCIVVEEADETVFWLELISEAKLLPKKTLYLCLKKLLSYLLLWPHPKKQPESASSNKSTNQ